MDVVRVFVLNAASVCLKEVADGNPDRALWALQACSIGCYQFLTPDDANYVQVFKYIERICVGAGRSKMCSPHLASFQSWLRKIKSS